MSVATAKRAQWSVHGSDTKPDLRGDPTRRGTTQFFSGGEDDQEASDGATPGSTATWRGTNCMLGVSGCLG